MFQVRLKELREKHGLSQYGLAHILHRPQSTIGNWEAGTRTPKADTLLELADYFDVSVDYLLGKDDKSNNEEKPATPKDGELSDAEKQIIELFRMVPKDRQDLVLSMIEAALKTAQLPPQQS